MFLVNTNRISFLVLAHYLYLGTHTVLDEEAFRKNIRETAAATKGCKVEYIFRDVMTIHGNAAKVKRAVEIVREEAGAY